MLLTNGCPLRAQRIISHLLPFYYELPSNEIFDIYQDREGYIWMGTTDGVARYDGYRIRYFRSDYRDMDLLTDNCSSTITDNTHYVWIGTRKGLNLYDKQTCRIILFPDTAFHKKDINYMATDQDECVWIASGPHLYRSNPQADKLKEYELDSETEGNATVNAVYVDRTGTVWALTNGKGLWKWDEEHDHFISYPPLGKKNAPYTLYQDNEDRYWIGTWSEGLWRFYPDRAINCYEHYPLRNPRTGQEEPCVYSLTQDDTYGYLWLLTYNALYTLDLEQEVPQLVNLHGVVDAGHMYTKLLKDREGNLWLSSYDRACTICFEHSGTDYRPLPELKQHFGQDANLLSLCVDKGGVVWMAQDRHGLCLYDMRQDTLAVIASVPTEPDFMTEARRKEGVWIYPRWGNEVIRLTRRGMDVSEAERIFLPEHIRSKGAIENMLEDRNGNLWILSEGGLYVSGVEEKKPDLDALTATQDGWVIGASADGHLYRLWCHKGKIKSALTGRTEGLAKNERAAYLQVDASGRVWMVTTLGRIFRQDKKSGCLRHLKQDNRIGDGVPLGLAAGGNNVWIVTNKKALCYDIYRNTYREYAAADRDIGVRLFRYRAFCTDALGGLYIGGFQGLAYIPAEGNKSPKKTARAIVTDVKVNGNSVFTGKGTEQNKAGHVILAADARNIELCFSTLQYAPEIRVRMAYKLDGSDQDWTYLDYGESSAFYNRLGKGTYTFRLKTEYGQGAWDETETVLTLTQQPAFYKTWWAYGIYACISAGVLGFVLWRYAHRLHRKDERKLKDGIKRTGKPLSFPVLAHQEKESSTSDNTTSDKRFLQRLTCCIEEHLEQPDFDLPALAHEMGMSKSTLRRKLQAAAGLTLQDFVRNVRMKRACALFAEGRMTVSEVAYAVGFTNPKYFSRCFKDKLGVTPTEYCEQLNKANKGMLEECDNDGELK